MEGRNTGEKNDVNLFPLKYFKAKKSADFNCVLFVL